MYLVSDKQYQPMKVNRAGTDKAFHKRQSQLFELLGMAFLYRRALDNAGYSDALPTRANVIACFKDYVDSGLFKETKCGLFLHVDDIDELLEDGEISINDICYNLINM